MSAIYTIDKRCGAFLGIMRMDYMSTIYYNKTIPKDFQNIQEGDMVMSVKEAVSVLKKAKSLCICYDGNAIPIDRNDSLMMDAYGKYLVDEIQAADDSGRYEIIIAMRPVKAGED